MLVHVQINGMNFEEDSSLTILQVCNKHGIHIPTLCYLKREENNFENKPGSCRVCVVEVVGRRNLVPACSTNIVDNMVVSTNNKRVREERKAVVELLLSNHPNECLNCEKSGNCELQSLATELGIKSHSFAGPLSQKHEEVIYGSLRKDPSKCILCHRCTEVCKVVQNVNAISESNRGFATIISEPYNCVNCGQCVQVCPTGALLQVDSTSEVERLLADESRYVVVQTAPAVRVALGEEFGLKPGTDVTKKMVTALRMLGFKKVFDTNFSADVTIMEEAKELVNRITSGSKNMPMITSCCPGWINYIETRYPELINLPSSCKSPQEMFSSLIKTYYADKEGIDAKTLAVVSLMPCIAKKDEITREALKINGLQATDASMSTKEFASMLRRYGIELDKLPDSEYDSPMGESSGAADIFGVAGGVMQAACRTASLWLTGSFPTDIPFTPIAAIPNAFESNLKINDNLTLRLCTVSGLRSASMVLDKVKSGEFKYDFIEIMACPQGCVNGGGQPINYRVDHAEVIKQRFEGLKNIDKNKTLRVSCENPSIKMLYSDYLKEPNSELAHHILHTTYKAK